MTAERVRTLLLRGDNLLKSGRPERFDRALAAFEEARAAAADDDVAPEVAALVERRIATLHALQAGEGA
ncbi:MAG TPA: hypothetical protein VD790_00395 [Thermoleophilaceae bacterium]|nr:hypothetical protein [Thermoleophilaceae bacterium]